MMIVAPTVDIIKKRDCLRVERSKAEWETALIRYENILNFNFLKLAANIFVLP
jgi:hypothetical protein